MVWTVEITAATDAAGTLTTLYVCDGVGFTTAPGETPANTFFHPRLIDPGSFERHCFDEGSTYGTSSVAWGYLDINDADHAIDAWIDYGFDLQPVVVRKGPLGGAYPADFVTVASLVAEKMILADLNTIRLEIRDAQAAVADLTINPDLFAGNNALPEGVEGTADDIGGSNKPIGYGPCFNVTPAYCNTSKHVFQFSVDTGQAATVDAVRDQGVALTKATQRATVADLLATAPAAGQWDWCYEAGKGLFARLGSIPNGDVTGDFTEGTNAAARTAAQIGKRILTGPGGRAAGELDSASVTALDTANAAVVGYWTGDAATIGDALDFVLGSVGAWWVADVSGVFSFGRLESPSGTPVNTFEDWEILALEIIGSNDDGEGLPCWRVSATYRPNYTEQDAGDLAGSVSSADVVTFGEAYLTSTPAEDATVLNKHAGAIELTFETGLAGKSDADAEASRQLAMRKVDRLFTAVTVHVSRHGGVDLGDVFQIGLNRYGWAGAKLQRCIGLVHDLGASTVTLYGWG